MKRTISTKDRRQRVVVLTSKGTRLLTRIEDRSNRRVLAIFEHLDSAEAELLLNAMDTNNVGVITKGELALTIDGNTTTHGIGEWYHVPVGVEHAAAFATDSAEIEFWFDDPCT